MTIHKIMVLIAPEPFGVRDSSNFIESFYIKADNTALFKDTIERTLLIEDDDDYFSHPINLNDITGGRDADRTGQTLVEDFNFGLTGEDHLLPAGTRLGRIAGSQSRDDNNNHFWVLFPYPYSESYERSAYRSRDANGDYIFARDEVFGARHAVLIFPLNKMDYRGREIKDEAGNSTLSVFDKNAVFRSNGKYVTPDAWETLPYPKCFTQGSLIQTPCGLRAVETLQKGDLVLTRDHGPQSVIWTGHTDIDQKDIELAAQYWPILIRQNALGQGLPYCDLMVSPQHRILVQSEIARRMFDRDEVLVAAKHLLGLPGIEIVRPKQGISYWHILLPRHELLLSHGAWTESFYLGAYTLRTLAPDTRAELQTIVPAIKEPDFKPRPARRLLTGREGRRLAQRHVKNVKPLITPDHLYLQALDEEIISMA